MSRVGKRLIEIPSGIKVEAQGRKVRFEAKENNVEYLLPEGFTVELTAASISVKRPNDAREAKALHGTTRTLLANIVKGLKDGFQKKLEIRGVGYKAQLKAKTLVLDIGKSHPVNFPVPQGITIETPRETEIIVKGIDKQKVGEAAAEIRALYPPEPYKGKGIRYSGEYVRKKQGKSIA